MTLKRIHELETERAALTAEERAKAEAERAKQQRQAEIDRELAQLAKQEAESSWQYSLQRNNELMGDSASANRRLLEVLAELESLINDRSRETVDRAWRAFERQQEEASIAIADRGHALLAQLPPAPEYQDSPMRSALRAKNCFTQPAGQLGNAVSPLPAAIQWASEGQSQDQRVRRSGIIAAIFGHWFRAGEGYDAQRVTDDDARAKLNREFGIG